MIMNNWYICQKCGYAHEGDEAPEFCPACGSLDFELETYHGKKHPPHTATVLLKKDIAEQVVELYWEYDRMSSCGKEALDKLAVMVNIPTQEEFEMESKIIKDIHNAST